MKESGVRVARSVFVGLLLAALSACSFDRTPNLANMAGVWISHGESPRDGGTAGGVSVQGEMADVLGDRESSHPHEPALVLSGSSELAIGGNTDGPSGVARLELEAGIAQPLSSPLALFARGGFSGTVAGSPYGRYLSFEFPTVAFGLLYHPFDADLLGAMHFELAVRGGLLDASRTVLDGHTMDRVAAGEMGPLVRFMTGLFSTRVEYLAIVRGPVVHQIKSSTCLGALAVVCVDTRHQTAPDLGFGLNGYFGVSVGLGWVAGVLPR